jgi:beta-barrel assembly-enhancing protease
MRARFGWIAVLAGLVVSAVAASRGPAGGHVDLSSAMELWSDLLRDTDGAGLHLARISARDEMRLGAELAGEMRISRADNPLDEAYVAGVATALTPYVRRLDIQYSVRLVKSTRVNAWALPGGHVYVTTGMLSFVESEAELAAILGHEIAHIDERHCIEQYQYSAKLGKVGAEGPGRAVDAARQLVRIGYSKYQEADADAAGLRLAMQAGYDPGAASAVMSRMAVRQHEKPAAPARTAVDEIGRAVGDALGSYFDSHPTSLERSRKLAALAARNRQRMAGEGCYVGKQNLLRRMPRWSQEFPTEFGPCNEIPPSL